MDQNLSGYLTFVILGVLLIVIDGQLIYRSGKTYLQQGYRDQAAAVSMAKLVAVLFHLIVLGLFLIISTIQVSADGVVQTVVTKLGVVLLLLGVMHAITVIILNRIRSRQREQRLADELHQQLEDKQISEDVKPSAAMPSYKIDQN